MLRWFFPSLNNFIQSFYYYNGCYWRHSSSIPWIRIVKETRTLLKNISSTHLLLLDCIPIPLLVSTCWCAQWQAQFQTSNDFSCFSQLPMQMLEKLTEKYCKKEKNNGEFIEFSAKWVLYKVHQNVKKFELKLILRDSTNSFYSWWFQFISNEVYKWNLIIFRALVREFQ